jgi:hypothetical protein
MDATLSLAPARSPGGGTGRRSQCDHRRQSATMGWSFDGARHQRAAGYGKPQRGWLPV